MIGVTVGGKKKKKIGESIEFTQSPISKISKLCSLKKKKTPVKRDIWGKTELQENTHT